MIDGPGTQIAAVCTMLWLLIHNAKIHAPLAIRPAYLSNNTPSPSQSNAEVDSQTMNSTAGCRLADENRD